MILSQVCYGRHGWHIYKDRLLKLYHRDANTKYSDNAIRSAPDSFISSHFLYRSMRLYTRCLHTGTIIGPSNKRLSTIIFNHDWILCTCRRYYGPYIFRVVWQVRRARGSNNTTTLHRLHASPIKLPYAKVPGKCDETSKSVEKSKNLPRNGQHETADLSRKYKIIT